MNKIFKVFFTVCFFLLTNNVFSQNIYENIIYLKDGGVLRGKIIVQIPEEYIKIEIIGGNVFVLKIADIKSIVLDTLLIQTNTAKQKTSGYFNLIEMGFLGSNGQYRNNTSLSPQTINGYQFNNYFFLGAGIGLDLYNSVPVIPLFLDVRGYFFKSKKSPFYYMQGGYGYVGLNNNKDNNGTSFYKYTGGEILSGGVGIKVTLNNNTSLISSVGLKAQKMKSIYTNWQGNIIEQAYEYNSVSIKFGIVF